MEKDQIYISYSKIQYYTLACPLCPQDAVKTSSIASHTMTLKQDGVSSHEVSFCTREKGRSFPKSAQVYFLQSHWSELRHMALLSCKKAWGEKHFCLYRGNRIWLLQQEGGRMAAGSVNNGVCTGAQWTLRELPTHTCDDPLHTRTAHVNIGP